MIATNSRSFDCLSILISVSNTRFCSHFNVLPVVWERLSRLVLTDSRFWFEFRKTFCGRFHLSVAVGATTSVSFDRLPILIRVVKMFSIFVRFFIQVSMRSSISRSFGCFWTLVRVVTICSSIFLSIFALPFHYFNLEVGVVTAISV